MGWWGAPKHMTPSGQPFDALTICDRCQFAYAHSAMSFQYQWAGFALMNTRLLVCETCLDVPNIQQAAIIIPPDPTPVTDPRPPSYLQNSYDTRVTQDDEQRITQNGDDRVTQTFIPED